MSRYVEARELNDKIDVWNLLFEQTPIALRWFFGIITLGIFSVLSILYHWHRKDMERVEKRIDRLEFIMMKVHDNVSRRRGDEE